MSAFARPKSKIFGCPSGPILMFRRFQVPMDDPFLMRSLQAFSNMDEQRDGLVERDRTPCNPLREGLAFDQLHDEALLAVVFFETIERGDVRVIELRK